MNIRSKNGTLPAVKLLKQEVTILESAEGICEIIRKTLGGERAGEEAAKAKMGLAAVLSILNAPPAAHGEVADLHRKLDREALNKVENGQDID